MCQIKRGLTIFAFLVLSVMVLILFGFTAYEAWTAHWLGGALSSIILIGVGFGVYFEGKAVFAAQLTVDTAAPDRAGSVGGVDRRAGILHPGA